MSKVVVIGAGIAGLSAAIQLAHAGKQVTILEKNVQCGGRAQVLHKDGFTFDMGPSWFMCRDIFEAWFQSIGERLTDHIELTALSPSYRIFSPLHPRGQLDIFSGMAPNEALFESLEPGSFAKFERYIARAQTQYEISKRYFLYDDLAWWQYLSPKIGLAGSKISLFPSIDKYVARYIAHPLLRQIIQYHLAFLGSSRYTTSALYSMMNFVDQQGVWYPAGGMNAVVEALVAIAHKKGVDIHTATPVTVIDHQKNRATLVHTALGDTFTADTVVFNGHIASFDGLVSVPRQLSQTQWAKKEWAPSAVCIFAGFSSKIPGLTHHNLVFAAHDAAYYADIFDTPAWPDSPNFYVCASSKTDPHTAPPGCENINIVLPVSPHLQASPEFLEKYAHEILGKAMAAAGFVEWQQHLLFCTVHAHDYYKSMFDAPFGTAIGLSHSLRQTGPLRPANKHRTLKNVYFVGADTNPGIGVPMCLISGQRTTRRILRELRTSSF
jgi:phytoene desaturase